MTTIGNQSRPAYVYDSETDTWVPIGVGPHTHDEYIEKILATAKGDILVGTAPDTVGKLAVGEDGQYLVVDLDSPSGLTWQTLNANIDVSATAPVDPTSGSVWFNSSEGTAYIFYDNYWVSLSPAAPGPQGEPGIVASDSAPSETDVLWLDTDAESPAPVPSGGTTGQVLAKASNANYDSQWTTLPTPPSGNVIINGAFEINQRNFSSSTSSSVYTFDRWRTEFSGGTNTYSAQAFTPGAAPVAGQEGTNFARIVTSGQSSTSHYTHFIQLIEDVRTFAGQTATISFWAKAGSGTPSIAAEWRQTFGTGGSSNEFTPAGKVTLSTSWTRYSLTVLVPGISGKTIAADNFAGLNFWLSAGSDFNTRSTSLGIQSNAFDIWGVQVEAGSAATAFRRNANSLAGELAACQRYFERLNSFIGSVSVSGSAISMNVPYATTKRVAPSFSFSMTNANYGTNWTFVQASQTGCSKSGTISIITPAGSAATMSHAHFSIFGATYSPTPNAFESSSGFFIEISSEL
jgi:hypothetical protein